jgi:hypothetical protein
MERTRVVLGQEAVDLETQLVHGIPWPIAEADADRVDWHQIDRLVGRGCPPALALRIVR